MQAAVQYGAVKTGEEDAAAKQRVADLTNAAKNLRTSVAKFMTAVPGADASLMAVHSSMAEVYPGNEEFAPSLVSLIGRSPIITDRTALESLKTEFEAGLTAVDEKLKTMKQLTDERAHFREEVQHYKDKLTKLEATEAAKVDPKTQQKVEENKAKLADMDAKFADSEGKLHPALDALDHEIATMTSDLFRKFVEVSINHMAMVNQQLADGLAGVPAPVIAPPAEVAAQ